MHISSNLAEVIRNLERLKQAVINASGGTIQPNFPDAIAAALNSGMGEMKNRIFNQGRDANGDHFGKYVGGTTFVTGRKFRIIKYGDTDDEKKVKKGLRKNIKQDASDDQRYTEYEKKRLAHGRQINKKDLEFNGSLRRSIETVRVENKAQIANTNPENALIAKYQEQQIGNIRATGFGKGSAAKAPIFRLSKEEFETVRMEGRKNITEVIKVLMSNK